uniref:AIG1-type G domain-containing protein n=1 Tax=Paramormyrops kingsleyae TaxID=1676925 RepID=A0A3B3TFK8_9TELE
VQVCTSTSVASIMEIVLLGKTGSGMSSAGNVILGEEKFKVSCDPYNVTTDCQTEEANFNYRKITVTDTPGIFDPYRSEEDLKYSIISCLSECAPGPHAFILVLQVGRHTEEEKESVKMILKWFGEEALKHTVVLFTHGDELKNQTITEFVDKNKDLKELVDKCDGRVHVIDSKHWNRKDKNYRSNSFQIKQLLTTIENMVKGNEGRCYTNESLELIAEAIQDEVNKIIQDRMKEFLEEAKSRTEIWKEARNKILKSGVAGAAVGSLLGLLHGVAVGAAVPFVALAGLFTAGVKSILGIRSKKTEVNPRNITVVEAVEGVTEIAGTTAEVAVRDTGAAAAAVGATGAAAKAGETCVDTNHAAKEAAKAAGQAELSAVKEGLDATQKPVSFKDSPYKKRL